MSLRKIAFPSLMILSIMIAGLACTKPEAPEYQGFQQIVVNKVDAQQTVLTANVKFYNPNPFNMELKKADINVFLNDKPANHYILDSTIQIPAKDSFWIPVTLQLDMKNLMSNALQSLLNDQLKIRMEGFVRVKRGGFGFRVPVHYEETQKLSSLIQGVN